MTGKISSGHSWGEVLLRLLAAGGGIVALGYGIFAIFMYFSPKPNSIHVVGIKHRLGANGVYFNFNGSELDTVLGRENWDRECIEISTATRPGEYRRAVVWKQRNDGEGTAHGRYETGARAGDWKPGDIIYVRR